jgi:hypothetical protein
VTVGVKIEVPVEPEPCEHPLTAIKVEGSGGGRGTQPQLKFGCCQCQKSWNSQEGIALYVVAQQKVTIDLMRQVRDLTTAVQALQQAKGR